jgi:Family of unknown function (DUF6263)
MIKYLLIFIFFNSIIFSQDDLKLNLEIGEEYLLYQHNEISMIQTIYGRKVRTYNEIDALNTYNVKAKTDSSILLEVAMKDLTFMISSPNLNLYYNSNEISDNDNILIKLLRRMIGLKTNIELSFIGKIISTDFKEIVSPSIISFFDSLDIPNKEKALNEIGEKIMQMSPSKNLETITNFLPLKKVEPGEKWTTNGNNEFGIPISYEREVTYNSKTEDIFFLESSANINTFVLPPSKRFFGNVNFNLTGNENFKIILSRDTRWFNEIDGESQLKGNAFQINGSDTLNIPIEMNFKDYYGIKKY